MGYKHEKFIDGQVLTASQLNNAFSILPEKLSEKDFGKQLFVNETGDGFLLIGNTTVKEWENLVDQAEVYRPGYIAGKGAPQSNGTTLYQAASSFYTAVNMPVKENTNYYLGGPNTSGMYARFVNWQSDKYTGLSETGTITSMTDSEIDAVTISMTGARSVEMITSPAGAKYCTVSFYDVSQGGTETNYFTTIADPKLRVDQVINNSIEIVDDGKWNLLESAEADTGNWFYAKKVNGNYQAGGSILGITFLLRQARVITLALLLTGSTQDLLTGLRNPMLLIRPAHLQCLIQKLVQLHVALLQLQVQKSIKLRQVLNIAQLHYTLDTEMWSKMHVISHQ